MKIVSVADVGETETSRCLQLLKVFCQCEIRRISYKVWKFPVSVNVIEQKVVKKEAQYFAKKWLKPWNTFYSDLIIMFK